MSESEVRHILSLSGGKDSAALAIYMRDRVPNMEYVFHDTGKELPDTYDYLNRLEAFLGKRIILTTAGVTFDDLLRVKGGMLPSQARRWCTELMKLKPFEAYIGDSPCINYIGIRADEKRVGYISHKPNIKPVYPFREDGIDYAGVTRILEDSGIGFPPYTDWGRTRSGCFFCFFQQKIEWVRLKQHYPDLFDQAKAYEKPNRVNGNVFYWDEEPLEELEKPERMEQIERNWQKAQERQRAKRVALPLITTLGGLEIESPARDGCLMCHL
ncbi:MAG TPA: phosphoadenosine phosphosulfate reductase family protein [Phycisphaerae bacterium]|nr:phosphoadenosine phosphosulfate reductase family protein [Phycisphaerae bacterium]